VEKVTRNLGEKRLRVAIFLDVVKSYDTVWVDGLLLEPTILNFPACRVKILSFYLHNRTFEASFQTTTATGHCMRAGVAQEGIFSPMFLSLYINDMPVPSCHVNLALYADDTAIIATSHKSALLIMYLETYFSDLERWL
jgi:hypothetical protein